jgi:energy-coupling factor transporter transmembrane protein EcfT
MEAATGFYWRVLDLLIGVSIVAMVGLLFGVSHLPGSHVWHQVVSIALEVIFFALTAFWVYLNRDRLGRYFADAG